MHYYSGLPLCKMQRLAFDCVLGSFSAGKTHCAVKAFISVLLKLRFYFGFLDIACRLCAPIATVSQKFHEILDLITCRFE